MIQGWRSQRLVGRSRESQQNPFDFSQKKIAIKIRQIKSVCLSNRPTHSLSPDITLSFKDFSKHVYLFQSLEGFCHFVAKSSEDKHFQQNRQIEEDVIRFQRMVKKIENINRKKISVVKYVLNVLNIIRAQADSFIQLSR